MIPHASRVGSALRLASLVLAFGTSVVLARVLGPRSFGEYSYVMAWLLLGVSFVQAGLPSLLVRESATHELQGDPKAASSLLGFGLVAGLGASALVVVVLSLLEALGLLGATSRALLYVGLPSVVLSAWVFVSEAMTRGTGRVLLGQLEQVIRPLVQIAGVMALAGGFLPRTPLAAMVAFSCSYLVAALVADRLRAARIPLAGLAKGFSEHAGKLRGLVWLSAIGWLGALSLQAATILLGVLSNEVEVAKYRVALQLGLLASAGVTVGYATHLPAINAALRAGDRSQAEALARASSRFCLGFGVLVIVPMILGGETLFGWVFGAEYGEAWLSAVILMGGQMVHAGTGVVAGILYTARAELAVLGSQVVFFCLRVAATIALIPRFGNLGAALAAALEIAIFHVFLAALAKRRAGIWSLPFTVRST